MCHGKGPPDLYVHFTILLLDVCYQFTIVLPAAYVLLYILLTAAFMFHIVDISCGICSFLYTTRPKILGDRKTEPKIKIKRKNMG